MTLPYGLLNTPDQERGPLVLPNALRAALPQRGPSGPIPSSRGSLWQRIQRRLMPVPGALQGLLSDEDVAQARSRGLLSAGLSMMESGGPVVGAPAPSFAQAAARGISAGTGAFDEALGSSVQMRQFAQQQQLTQQKEARRQAIFQKYPLNPKAKPEEVVATIQRMLPEFIAINDIDMVRSMVELLKSQGDKAASRKPAPQEIRVGNEVILRDPETGKEVGRYPIKPSPRDPNAPDTAQQLRDQRMFSREQQLADDYNKDTKETRETARNVAAALAEADNALKGDGMAQVNMLYAFVSAMDPGTAVKEGEVGLVRSAASLRQQAAALIDKYMKGESVVVPGGMVNQMRGLMQRRLTGMKGYVDSRAKYYAERAQRWGVASDVFPGLEIPTFGSEQVPGNTGNASNVRQFLKKK